MGIQKLLQRWPKRRVIVEMKVGDWIVVSESGIWCSPFNDNYTFVTKKEAVKDVADAKLDVRNKPKIRRITSGLYEYILKSCDQGYSKESYSIIKLNKHNVENYIKMVESQELI